MRRGSISIYLSLTMLVLTALLAAVFYSVRAQAGRMQLANSVDQALFSTFAQYDRDLLENFDVFFIDGSCGTDSLCPLMLSDRIEDAMSYILHPKKGRIAGGGNLLSLSVTDSYLTGYTLATDVNGQIFASYVVHHAKVFGSTAPMGTHHAETVGIVNENAEVVFFLECRDFIQNAQSTGHTKHAFGDEQYATALPIGLCTGFGQHFFAVHNVVVFEFDAGADMEAHTVEQASVSFRVVNDDIVTGNERVDG